MNFAAHEGAAAAQAAAAAGEVRMADQRGEMWTLHADWARNHAVLRSGRGKRRRVRPQVDVSVPTSRRSFVGGANADSPSSQLSLASEASLHTDPDIAYPHFCTNTESLSL